MEDAELAVHCVLRDAADLLAGLESAQIEHLDVDTERAIVIYRSAILMVAATERDVTAARAFDVELWEPPLHARHLDPEDVLEGFVDEFVAALPTTRRDD